MKIWILMLIVMTRINLSSPAQSPMPLKEWPSPPTTPFVFYLSGDGGMNHFSNSLCAAIHDAGYAVTALDSKSYFSAKKDPLQTALAISEYLEAQFRRRQQQQLVLIGYSFGADVLSFIINHLPAPMKGRLHSTVLISPSTSTDFQVHWSDMFGGNTKRSMDVLREINSMRVEKFSVFFGKNEDDFPAAHIAIPHQLQVLPGGHRYDGHMQQLGEAILKAIR